MRYSLTLKSAEGDVAHCGPIEPAEAPLPGDVLDFGDGARHVVTHRTFRLQGDGGFDVTAHYFSLAADN
ncbi:MAG: hypothetical protein IT424_07030 [Pirellulales bacterium]|nr:hypothetical protein [Pirellulales bacterium]